MSLSLPETPTNIRRPAPSLRARAKMRKAKLGKARPRWVREKISRGMTAYRAAQREANLAAIEG
jgi:hypothetical protein